MDRCLAKALLLSLDYAVFECLDLKVAEVCPPQAQPQAVQLLAGLLPSFKKGPDV